MVDIVLEHVARQPIDLARVAHGADGLGGPRPVQIGHHEVHQDGVVRRGGSLHALGDDVHRQCPVLRLLALVAVALHHPHDHLAVHLRVVDHKQTEGSRGGSREGSRGGGSGVGRGLGRGVGRGLGRGVGRGGRDGGRDGRVAWGWFGRGRRESRRRPLRWRADYHQAGCCCRLPYLRLPYLRLNSPRPLWHSTPTPAPTPISTSICTPVSTPAPRLYLSLRLLVYLHG